MRLPASKVDLEDGRQFESSLIIAARRQEQRGGGDGPVVAAIGKIRARKQVLSFAGLPIRQGDFVDQFTADKPRRREFVTDAEAVGQLPAMLIVVEVFVALPIG